MSPRTTPRKTRRWIRFLPRFGLRTLLILVAVIGVPFGLFTRERERVYSRIHAVEEITRLGGELVCGLRAKRGHMSRFFQGIILRDDPNMWTQPLHCGVLHVSLEPRSDCNVDLLHSFPELVSLRLTGPDVTDATIAHLTHLRHLVQLFLERAAISERALQSLQQLPHLEHIAFTDCSTFDRDGEQCLRRLAELPSLKSLEFVHCRLTDESLQALITARGLADLYLEDTDVTEAGLLIIRTAKPSLRLHLP